MLLKTEFFTIHDFLVFHCVSTIIYLLILLVLDYEAASIFLPWHSWPCLVKQVQEPLIPLPDILTWSVPAESMSYHILTLKLRAHAKWYLLVITNEAEHIFICFYAIHVSSIMKSLCVSLTHFPTDIFLFNLLNNNPLLILCVSNIFYFLSTRLLLVLKHLLNRGS